MKKYTLPVLSVLLFLSCHLRKKEQRKNDPYLVVLGIAQDAGYPQAGCTKECCVKYWEGIEDRKNVTCLGLVIPAEKKLYLFEATPDFTRQWQMLKETSRLADKKVPDCIFLTHAHMGHYTGLIQTGREAMGAHGIAVYTMPRMKNFLEQNGPWKQLVDLGNIRLATLKADSVIWINKEIGVTPFLVPHRDEYSETVGFKIISTHKKILFIPDIDKWQKWDKKITDEIRNTDVAFLDGTFFRDGEIDRNMNEVPHPFVAETMSLFDSLAARERNKIVFIHFNHTNPLLRNTPEKKQTSKRGYRIAYEGMKINL